MFSVITSMTKMPMAMIDNYNTEEAENKDNHLHVPKMTKMPMAMIDNYDTEEAENKDDLLHVPFLLSGGANSAPHSSTLSKTSTMIESYRIIGSW